MSFVEDFIILWWFNCCFIQIYLYFFGMTVRPAAVYNILLYFYYCCCVSAEASTHLYGVVQDRAGRVQRQVLERFDLRSLPAVLLRPADGQHVVGELFAEHQGGRVGLRLACCAALDDEICCLTRETDRRAGDGRRKRRRRDKSRAGDEYSDCF